MEAANQDLSSGNVQRVDLELNQDKEDEAGDDNSSESADDAEDSSDESAEAVNDTLHGKTPTIQIDFALGKMNDNPVMQLLSGDGSGDEDSDDENGDDCGDDSRKRAVESLLREDETKEPETKKRPLIEEM
eukprot:CAMPEP_0176009462 /NCGR_PEP_ID=MMETSP0120_2-20121206/4263_1 /TAXON_ID=160619 /ORGANISM="Kryptoperidinium foliaceum, Strain CCMP 1326" /LENGTH=130 /DNA_ID=CAMNT_0017342259 /DNA_START=117 /DNA_END=509 /DNA_ORIENTATION=-